ncbi:hypothetical protein BUY19_04425 [Staphylococcus cohnii]|nr:hypothetical protein BUY19_04425 [Staphylococcus cohnii]
MRLTFIHDHKFIEINNEFYSTGKFNQKILNRYKVGEIDNIQIIARLQDNEYSVESLSKISSDSINVKPIRFLKNKYDFFFKKKKIENFLKNNLDVSDAIIVRLPSEIGYIALKYLNKEKFNYGIEMVGDPWDALWYHNSPIGKIMAIINRNKTKSFLKKSPTNIYVTKYYLQNKYPSKGNNYNASNVFIDEVNDDYRVKEDEVFRIGMIASLDTKYKGIDTALKSLKRLKNKNINLEIVGNGPKEKWEEKIEKLNLKENVSLKGTLKGGYSVYKWMQSLDLYIQPSYTEGLPRALIEAMSNGVPVLASNVGGIPELLSDKYMHNAKDYKTFAKQIFKVYEDTKLRREMSKENIEISKNYLKQNIDEQRILFIKSIYGSFKNE